MQGPSLPDHWLVDAAALRVYAVPAGQALPAGSTPLVTLGGETVQVDAGSLGPFELEGEAAGAALRTLLDSPDGRAALLGEVDLPADVAALLGARSEESFMAALVALTGTTDPQAVEVRMDALEASAAEARRRLAAGEGPGWAPSGTPSGGAGSHPWSALLLALARRGAPPAEAAAPAPVKISVPAPQLDVSWSRAARVIGTDGTGS